MKPSKIIGLAFATSMALALVACGDKDKEEQKQATQAVEKLDMLRYVPADTPYVFANARPLPDKLTARLLSSASKELERSTPEMIASLEASAAEDPDLQPLSALLKALVEELKGKISAEGLASLGIPANGQTLMYGLGMLPVIRAEILDAAKVEALIGRIEQRAAMSAKQLEHQGIRYREFELGELVGILAVNDKQLVAALLPTAEQAQLLPVALGLQMPDKSLAKSGAFKKMLEDNGLAGYGDGYVDLVHITEMALGESKGVNALIWNALDTEPTEISAGCRFMAKAMAQSVPRFSAGMSAASDDSYTMKAVFETSPTIAGHLQKIAAPVPGVGKPGSSLVSIGAGMDLPALRDAAKAAILEMQKISANCEEVDQDELKQSLLSLDMALNPMASGVKGFNLLLNDIAIDPNAMESSKVDANLLLAVADPKGTFALFSMLNPEFATLQLPDDGTPVALPLEAMMPTSPKVWVAAKGSSLAFTTNTDAKAGVSSLFAAPVSDPAPILSVSYDGSKLAAKLEPAVEPIANSQDDDESANEMRDIYAAFRDSAADYDRIDLSVMGGARGLVIQQQVKLK